MSGFINQHDVIEQFKDFAQSEGIELPADLTPDGQLHRFKLSNEKAGKLSGAYVLHLDGRPAGYVQDFRTETKVTWTYNDPDYKPVQLTPEQRKQQAEDIRQSKERTAKERAETKAAAAEKANYLWSKSKPLTDNKSHPYLVRKSIKGAYLLRINDYKGVTSLVIPLGKDDKLTAIQFIQPEKPADDSNDKKVVGDKAGSYFRLNKIDNPRYVAIGEGFATVASVIEDESIKYKAGFMGVMAVDVGNLEAVAVAMREKYPTADILIFGDKNDQNSDGTMTHTGEKAARSAAKLANGYCIMPPVKGNEKMDFNDYLTSGNVTTSLDDLITAAVNEAYEASQTSNTELLNVAGPQNNDLSYLDNCPDFSPLDHSTMPHDHAHIGNDTPDYEGDTVTSSTLETAPTTTKIKELNDHETALLNGIYSKAEQPIGKNRQSVKAELEQLRTEHNRKPLFTPISDLIKTRKCISWVIRDYLPLDSTCMVYGESGAGKSFLALDMALHVATGKEWQDKKTKKGAVFYVAGEGQTGITARCHAWALHHDVNLENVPFYCTDGAVIPTNDKQLNDLFSDITHWIESTGEQPLLVFFDTLARCFDGDENSAKDAGRYIQAIDKIKKQFKCCVVTVHHTGKDTGRGGRGSSAFKGAWDMEHALSVKDGGIKQLETTKAKDIATPIDKFFTLESVKTNWLDDDMEVITSAVIVSTEYTPNNKAKTNLKPNDEKVLSSLKNALNDSGIEPIQAIKDLFLNSNHNTPIQVVNIENWRAAAYESITVDIDESTKDKSQAKRKEFKRIREKLEKIGLIGLHGGYAWIVEY